MLSLLPRRVMNMLVAEPRLRSSSQGFLLSDECNTALLGLIHFQGKHHLCSVVSTSLCLRIPHEEEEIKVNVKRTPPSYLIRVWSRRKQICSCLEAQILIKSKMRHQCFVVTWYNQMSRFVFLSLLCHIVLLVHWILHVKVFFRYTCTAIFVVCLPSIF